MIPPLSDLATRAQVWIGLAPEPLAVLAKKDLRYEDSDDFLLSAHAFDHGIYVVDLVQQGVPGLDLVRLIRRRSTAGIVALIASPHTDFVRALELGADAVADRTGPAAHVEAIIASVRRRMQAVPDRAAPGAWKLDQDKGTLVSPDGTQIDVSRGEVALLLCFAAHRGATVRRAELTKALWGDDAMDMDNALHAALYRLRKRVEEAGQPFWPVHAVSKVGYEFRAELLSS